jgi:hypothetical protein
LRPLKNRPINAEERNKDQGLLHTAIDHLMPFFHGGPNVYQNPDERKLLPKNQRGTIRVSNDAIVS